MQENPKQARSNPKWHLLYFVLAAFDVLTVSASLYLNHVLIAEFDEAVEINREWAKRSGDYSNLAGLAVDVNMPGNEVFDTLDVEGEQAEQQGALRRFEIALEEARAELSSSVHASEARPLMAQLDDIAAAMSAMTVVQAEIFDHFRNDERAAAGAKMATMDRENANVAASINEMGSLVRGINRENFAAQAKQAQFVRQMEYLIAGMIVLMVLAVTWYGHKISQQAKRAQAALETAAVAANSANQAKSEFLANMSHEIRTPMTAILGYTEILQGTDAESMSASERDRALKSIYRNGDHLLTIINDILDMSKIEAGKMKIERISTNPATIVDECASLLQERAQGKGIGLEINYDTVVPNAIQTDPTRLRQIVLNLMGNAIKFTEIGKVALRVKFDTETNLMHFQVIDTGVGMNPQQRDAIARFDAFSQADTSTARKFGGSGLGLRISNTLAGMLGGGIDVESAVGKGSVFTATVDAGDVSGVAMINPELEYDADQPSTPSAEKQNENEAPRLDGLTVLLAEDGPDNQRLISFVVKKAGANVQVAENGLIAFEAALEAKDSGRPFDVILMDMQMPEMDGYTATTKLRESGYDGPIIALTAHALSSDRQICLDAGCDEYTTKPIDRQHLISLLAEAAAPVA